MKTAFLKRFIANPRRVGAILPSGKALVSRVIEGLPLENATAVVELGPGLGTITEHLVAHVGPNTDCVVIEIDRVFVRKLRERFPTVTVVNDSAETLPAHMHELGYDHVDAIVCGLPFANLPNRFLDEVIAAAKAVLRPGGVFATYGYVHGHMVSRRLKQTLERNFSHVETRLIMPNVPPAIVFHAHV